MGVLAIELNDAGLRAARSTELLPVDGEQRSSPGCALSRGGSLVTGVAAAGQACLHPTSVGDRFWDQLDTEPQLPTDPRSPNRAEVACAHLRQVLDGVRRSGDDLVIAVPAFYEARQLGILVGIARELGLPLKALVAGPIALDPGEPRGGAAAIVEVTIHRSAVSTVEIGERVRLGATRICPDVSLHALRRQWVKAIGAEFVRTTRFDPLHDAATEQQMHDRLPEILEALAQHASHLLEIQAGRRAHRITVTDQLLAHAGHSLVFRLCNEVGAASPSAVLLTHEAALVPGLQRTLQQQMAAPVRGLDPGAAALGLARLWPQHFEEPAAEGVAFHRWRHAGPVVNGQGASTG